MTKIDDKRIESHLARLSEVTATPGRGVTRLPFSPQMKEAAQMLIDMMQDAGMEAQMDASGAVIGTLVGRSENTIVIASHYDTVQHGGGYDGIAGVVCGIEIARALAQNADRLPFTVSVVATNDEEGARFGTGFFSAKAFLGQHTERELKESVDADGITIWQAMQDCGLDPSQIGQAAWNMSGVRAFFEIHIEQGPVLEHEQAEIGIVSGIVGMCRRMITVRGVSGHAGTVPMNNRCDAVEVATKCIAQVADIARRFEGAVATVGHIDVSPNAINTIAEQVIFSLDIRSMDEGTIHVINRLIDDEMLRLKNRFGAQIESVTTLCQAPAPMDADLREMLRSSAHERGRIVRTLQSGAGHDSLPMAGVVPTAMLFVPSRGGVSHCPQEWSSPRHLAQASEVLYDTILDLMEVSKHGLSE